MKSSLLPAILIAVLAVSLGSFYGSSSRKALPQPVTLILPEPVQDMPVEKTPIVTISEIPSPSTMGLYTEETRSYTYVFAGSAICGKRPCAHTEIDVHIVSGDETQKLQATTDKNGRFSVAAIVQSKPYELVSWEVSGQNEQEKGRLEGRQIPAEDSHIELHVPLQLASL